MNQKEIQFRKKREIGDIISDSFEFLKQEYKLIFKLVLVYVLPFIVLYGFVQVNVQMKIMGSVDFADPESLMSNIGPIYMNVFLSSLFALFVQSLLAGTFYSFVEIYVKKGKGNFDLSEITPLLFSNGLLALGANLVLFLIVIVGFILCIVPSIYFANTFSLVVMIVIFEKKRLGDVFSRSWNLVNSQWWNTFLLNILGVVIVWVLSFVVSIPVMISGVGSTISSLQETGVVEQPISYWVITGISTAISALFWVIPYTFMAFQYFNLDEQTKPSQPPVQNIF